MSKIQWEDPPIRTRGNSGIWVGWLEPLIEHPMRWAMLREYSKPRIAAASAYNLRRGMMKIPPGRWEFLSRKSKVYARYLGPEEAEPNLKAVGTGRPA